MLGRALFALVFWYGVFAFIELDPLFFTSVEPMDRAGMLFTVIASWFLSYVITGFGND